MIYCKNIRQFPASLGMLEAKESLTGDRPAKVKPRLMVWLEDCHRHCHLSTHSHPYCWTPNAPSNCPCVFVSLSQGSDFQAGSSDWASIMCPCSSCLSAGRRGFQLLAGLPTRFIQRGSFQIGRVFKCGIAKKDKCLLQADIITLYLFVSMFLFPQCPKSGCRAGLIKTPITLSRHCFYFILLLLLTSLLEYNCFTMVCQFLLYNKMNQLYICI